MHAACIIESIVSYSTLAHYIGIPENVQKGLASEK